MVICVYNLGSAFLTIYGMKNHVFCANKEAPNAVSNLSNKPGNRFLQVVSTFNQNIPSKCNPQIHQRHYKPHNWTAARNHLKREYRMNEEMSD